MPCSRPLPAALAAVLAVLACLAAAATASAASHVSVSMTGAGTVQVDQVGGGLIASCPQHAPLGNPDNGPAIAACAMDWAPTCTPGGSAATCALAFKAVAKLPAPPDLTQGELGGWAFTGWSDGPCKGTRATTCSFTVGSCAKDGTCTYADVGLGVAFDDTRAPTARFEDPPSGTLTDSAGRVAVSLRSNEYTSQETSHFECRVDQGDWAACPGPPATWVVTVDDGPHQLRVRAVDPSGNRQTA